MFISAADKSVIFVHVEKVVGHFLPSAALGCFFSENRHDIALLPPEGVLNCVFNAL